MSWYLFGLMRYFLLLTRVLLFLLLDGIELWGLITRMRYAFVSLGFQCAVEWRSHKNTPVAKFGQNIATSSVAIIYMADNQIYYSIRVITIINYKFIWTQGIKCQETLIATLSSNQNRLSNFAISVWWKLNSIFALIWFVVDDAWFLTDWELLLLNLAAFCNLLKFCLKS